MSGPVANADAYQILADLLVTIRRIIHRGLVKVSGSTWYLDGCPPGLFEELVARKENEKAIDRFDGEYQELITFASLDDLAAIIEYNSDLQDLLSTLESEGTSIIERLRKIEALRLKLAASVPFEDDDHETLIRYHREFRDSLTRRKPEPETARPDPPPVQPVQPPEDTEPQPAPEKSEPEPETEESELEEAFKDDKVGSGPQPGAREAADGHRDFGTQAATFEELVEVVGGAGPSDGADRPASEASEISTQSTVEAEDPGVVESDSASLVIDAELAMAEDNDREVLRVLHREVTSIAECAFRNMLAIEQPVWETVRSSGWYDMKKADLALAPLELFYTVVTRAGDIQRSGAGIDAVKASLEEAEFSKLLLSLREMFMRHSL